MISLLESSLFLILMIFSTSAHPWSDTSSKIELSGATLKNIQQKMLPAFIAGIPEFGIQSMDPMSLGDINTDLKGFRFYYKNGFLDGLKNTDLDIVEIDMAERSIHIKCNVDNIFRGSYVAGGTILDGIPIYGHGFNTITSNDMVLDLYVDFSVQEISGKSYVVPESYKYDVQVLKGVSYVLMNLYNGDREMRDKTVTAMNENWRTILQDYAGPMIDVVVDNIYNNIVKYTKYLSIEEIVASC